MESILEICDIEFSDDGDYICIVEDGTTSSTTIRVTVLEGMLYGYYVYCRGTVCIIITVSVDIQL